MIKNYLYYLAILLGIVSTSVGLYVVLNSNGNNEELSLIEEYYYEDIALGLTEAPNMGVLIETIIPLYIPRAFEEMVRDMAEATAQRERYRQEGRGVPTSRQREVFERFEMDIITNGGYTGAGVPHIHEQIAVNDEGRLVSITIN